MFKRAIISTIFLLLVVGGYLFYYCFYIFPKDINAYEKELENHERKKKGEKNLSPTYQERVSVQKDIWSSTSSYRLHYQIQADSSILTLTPCKEGVLLQEKMNNLLCLIQEKIYPDRNGMPVQNIKSFTSNHGIYDFNQKCFRADKVLLNFYTVDGETLPSIMTLPLPYLKGKAQRVFFSLNHNDPYFHAEKFKGELISYEGVTK